MTSTPVSRGLTRAESLALLGSVPVARVAFQLDVLPTVVTVNVSLEPGGLLVTARSEPLQEAARRKLYVVLEGDDVDLDTRSGWAVGVVGRAELVDDPAGLGGAAPVPWTAGTVDRQIRIAVDLVEGRRVGNAHRTSVRACPTAGRTGLPEGSTRLPEEAVGRS
ncbi:MAG: hypothetical protein JWL64_2320 [Frankiales bacterium]|nr:hypothetical protein [Frankiales bacterium]